MSHPHPQTYPSLRARVAVALRSAKPVFLIAASLLFTCSLLTLLAVVPPAFADERAPDAPGGITGVIKNAQGEPQAGISVTLYKFNPTQSNVWSGIRSTQTGVDGIYRFPLLSVGVYRIGVIDPNKVYAESYYPAAAKLSQGTDIPVLGNQLTHIDLTLQLGSQITGLITTTNTMSVTHIYVTLFRQADELGNNNWQSINGFSIDGSSGVYSFTGLSATTYRICAQGYSSTFAIYECYDNVYEVSRATDLTLTVGTILSDVNMVLGDGADYAQISGQAVTANNEPLADIDVYAFPVGQAWPIRSATSILPIPTATPGSSLLMTTGPGPGIPYYAYGYGYPYYGYPYYGYSARTDSQGNYHLPMVTAGEYIFSFNDPDGQYAFAYYPNVQVPEEATVLKVAQKQIITNVNAQLEVSGHIVGNLTILGQPAANAYISVELETPFGWRAVRSVQTDANTGHYAIDSLPAGSYRVAAYGSIYDGYMSYTYQGYFGGNTQETATEITLTVGETKTADIALTNGPQFEGSISGRITASGAPVAGIKVLLYRGGSLYCCSPSDFQPVVYVFTDADGRYTLSGLTTNPFHVGAIDPAGIYATTYYTGYAVPALANLLTVEDGKATTGIDIDLPRGGGISGRVTLRDGQPVAGLLVFIYGLSLNDPLYSSVVLISADTQTDVDGRYAIKGLHANDYYVCFSTQPNQYSECYGMLYFNYSDSSTGRVKVVAGATTTDIDLIWGPDLTYYLPIIGQ